MKREKGFTLIELLVVIAIAALLAMTGYQSIASRAPGQQLAGAGQEFRSELNRVKTLALRDRVQYRVTVSGTSYSILKGNQSTGSTAWTTEATRQLGFEGINLNGGPFTFDPRGTAISLDNIRMTNSEGTRTITLTLTVAGRIRSS